MLGNMDNICLLRRQQAVEWPEFSWETVPNDSASRCFQMFSRDISRIGYTDEGRVYSIICPQQGTCSPYFGCLNVEITVTGQRGWVDENNRELAADMTVEAKVWFSPSALETTFTKLLWTLFETINQRFPLNKANAIVVTTHKYQQPDQPVFSVRKGEATRFKSPPFARHTDSAWSVGNVEVQIGSIKKTEVEMVDEFNHLIINIFNFASGNLLKCDNLLTWNVWFTTPKLVDKEEWRTHAERWRESIDADHGSPTGPGSVARFFDGTLFKPVGSLEEMEANLIKLFLSKYAPSHLSFLKRLY